MEFTYNFSHYFGMALWKTNLSYNNLEKPEHFGDFHIFEKLIYQIK